MKENTGKNIFDFSLGDDHCDLLDEIVPLNIQGLTEVVDFVKSIISGIDVTNVEFSSMTDDDFYGYDSDVEALKIYNKPIVVSITVGNPDPKLTTKHVNFSLSNRCDFYHHIKPCKSIPDGPPKMIGVFIPYWRNIIHHMFDYIHGIGSWDAMYRKRRRQLESRHSFKLEDPGDTFVNALGKCVYHEVVEKNKELKKKLETSILSGELKDSLAKWQENNIRDLFQQAVAPFSDIPIEQLHTYLDELIVKEVMEV